MEKVAARQLADTCVPLFEQKGVANITTVDSASSKTLLGLWTGMGSIDEIMVHGEGLSCSFVAKTVGSGKGLSAEKLVDHVSYENEAKFYESPLPDRICDSGASCPRPLFVDRKVTGVDAGALTICMTKLSGGVFRRSKAATRAALAWLARLHSLFWGKERVEEALASGVYEHACFWSLVRRDVELERMRRDDPLRLAASGIHARLMADKMQTMCHGDPKSANIMWDDDMRSVRFYDFQWFGQAPPSKDLAYFIGINGGESEETLLQYYHAELSRLLEAQGDVPPTFEYLWISYCFAQADLCRWMTGGFSFGNTRLIFGHAKALLYKLDGGTLLSSSEEYQERIFQLFPP